MNVLPLPAERSGTLRVMPTMGDNMAPTLRPGDAVAVRPVGAYCGEGLYVFEVGGAPVIYRAQGNFRGGVDLTSDSPAYTSIHTFTPAEFAGAVLGKVAAICTVLDGRVLRGAVPLHG